MLQLQLHYFANTTLDYITLYYTRVHNTTAHYTTVHYTTLHCTTLSTLLYDNKYNYNYHHDYNCNSNCANYTTLRLQLHDAALQLQLQLHHTTLHPAVVVRWPLQPLQPLQKTQLHPPFGPSVDSLCHPWFTTTNLSYRFPIFETSATALCSTTGIW